MAADPDPDTRAHMGMFIDAARRGGPGSRAAADLAARFTGPLAFGTAGLRGPIGAGESRMNVAVVIRATAGLMAWLNAQIEQPRVVIGCDARYGSRAFAEAAAEVVSGAGGIALTLPPCQPTPLTSFSVKALDADAGIMVTASHNPGGDNGYKVYTGGRVAAEGGAGVQIIPPADSEISQAISEVGPAALVPRDFERIQPVDTREKYVARAAALAEPGDVRIALTPMHGVGAELAVTTLRAAGFEAVSVVPQQAKPDPTFPTVSFPNPEEAGALDLAKAHATSIDADIIVALDPDADRCAVCAPEGDGWRQLSGDELGLILGDYRARRASEEGRHGVLATSIVSRRGLAAVARSWGMDYASTLTGFKWIARVPDVLFGFEEAIGYCPDPQAVADKDGIATAVLVASVAAGLKAQGRTLLDALDDVACRVGAFRTRPLVFRVSDQSLIAGGMARLREHAPSHLGGQPVTQVVDLSTGYEGLPPTDGMLLMTQGDSRVVVRPSGTEPKLKCYLEAHEAAPEDADQAWARATWPVLDARLDALARDVAQATGFAQ